MTAPCDQAQMIQQLRVRPQSLAEARAGIDAVIEAQLLSKGSGYVKVDDKHYHVAQTVAGPIVSLVQWKVDRGECPGFAPVHDLFSVNLEGRDKAVYAWNNRHTKIEEANVIKATELAASNQPHQTAPMKSTRTGAR